MRSVPASKADSEVMQPITHYENFPVASWLCPPALRAPIAAIYHYARTADDLADEGDAHADQRLADLMPSSVRPSPSPPANAGPRCLASWPP